MINDKSKLIAAVAVTLIISGCSSGDSGGSADSQTMLDDPIAGTANEATTPEVTVSTQTSTGLAVPAIPVSSAQMDAFVKNPLVASIPAELNGSSTNALSRRYITNPLVN